VSSLSRADQALCEAYVDGQLTPERQRWFERRVKSEPRLSRMVRELRTDAAALERPQYVEEIEDRRPRRLRPWAWTASLSVALSMLAVFGIDLAFGKPAPAFDVALVPGHATAHECIDSFPELRGLRPPGLDALLGGTGAANVGATEFEVRATTAEKALVGASRGIEVSAGTFVVGLDLAGEADVLVVAVPKFGETKVLFPAYSSGEGLRLPAGEHVLPGRRFDVTGARVRYRPGFAVPVGAGSMEVLVAVRTLGRRGVDPEVFTGRRPAEQVQRALESAGYEVRRLRVTEPAE
jgi:hypothetical protein